MPWCPSWGPGNGAFSAEALINNYAYSKLNRNYYKNYLDKLDLLSKFIIVPRILSGKEIDPGSEPLQQLAGLIGQRNNLVHFKSYKKPVWDLKDKDVEQATLGDAEKALKTTNDLIQFFCEIDPAFSPE